MNKTLQLILAIIVVSAGVAVITGGTRYAESQYQDKVAKINDDIIDEASDAVLSLSVGRTEKATQFVYEKREEVIKAAKISSRTRRYAQWAGGAIAGAGVLWFFLAAVPGSGATVRSPRNPDV